MSLTWEQLVTVIGAGSTIGSAIFWGALWLGRLTNRIERGEQRLDDSERRHVRSEARIDEHGRQIAHLAGGRRVGD